jgi:micrococcal nuclease
MTDSSGGKVQGRYLARFVVPLAFLIILTCAPIRAKSPEICAAFDNRVWAQTVFDEDRRGNAALDPDRDGLACEELPLGTAPAPWTATVPSLAEPVTAVSVTDGDTIDVVRFDGRLESVRMIGVDAPESGGPYRDVECFGLDAADFLARQIDEGGQLYLERDLEDRDQYGRLLRWVWLERDEDVFLLNEALIRSGYAERYRDTPNRRYVSELVEAEEFAREYGLGLWSACEDFAPVMASEPVPAPPRTPSSGCDPAYPDVCIPPPPPDLSCRDVPYSRFRVLPPDPHGFDGNRDGVACEGPG